MRESCSRSADFIWCERGDLNPHGLPRQILSLVRLPISPLSLILLTALHLRLYQLFNRLFALPQLTDLAASPFDATSRSISSRS